MKTDRNWGIATRCVHQGEIEDPQGSPHTPLYNTTTFVFPDTQSLVDVMVGDKPGNIYTRYGTHPNVRTLEAKLAMLEGAEAALCFGSGVAAESATLLALGREGIVCVGDVYGGTYELLDTQLRSLGFEIHFLLKDELDQLESLLKTGIGMVYFESPSNPVLDIQDIAMISDLAHAYGALVCIDNTFATPINQNPLALGADIVVHSATKYLGGHSDITAGAVMSRNDLIGKIRPWRKNLGQVPSPEVASLLCRSIRTLVIRVERQNNSALKIAQALENYPGIKRVLYPGLSGFPGHELASRQMKGFGGMMTIEFDGGLEDASRVADRLELIRIGPSLGGAESLCTQPVMTSHFDLTEDERARRGITPSMMRLSVGFEEPEDLIADIRQALER